MPKTELGYKHTVHLETITPVAIGDGGTLSPTADYTENPQNNQNVLLLDHNKIETWLRKNKEAITDYLNKVQKNTEKNRNTFLYDFLSKYHDKKEVLSFFKGERSVIGNADKVQLKTCIKDADRPFIPGSTLKGAFKSVWLHNWLKANIDQVDKIIEVIKSARDDKDAQKKIDAIISECLDDRPSHDQRMQFSTLQISDAYCNGDLIWYHTERFKLLEDKKMNLPLFFEAIAPSSEGSFSLMVESNKLVQNSHRSIKVLENDSLVPFFAQVNQYALDNIKHELEMTQTEGLWEYKQFLQKLKNNIQSSDNQSAWLPVGFGKSNFYQSIGLFIRQRDKVVFERFIKLFKMGKKLKAGETEQKELPLTRNLTLEGHLPLGWIRLYDREPVIVNHFKQDDQIEATVVNVIRPYSKIKIPGVDGLIDMSGTKDAQKSIRFKVQAVVVVQIDVNKEGKISHARFVRVK
jgi:CRISPR-associated protein Csm5